VERIGVRELRQHASRYLAKVKAGESVEVTERGRLVAMLVPPHRDAGPRERLIAEGRLLPSAGPLRAPRRIEASGDTADVLAELRDER
jgi:prevent-host-death family protein